MLWRTLDGQRDGFAVAGRRERFKRCSAPLVDSVERRAAAEHHLVVGHADDVDPNVAQLLVSDAVGVGVLLGTVELGAARYGHGWPRAPVRVPALAGRTLSGSFVWSLVLTDIARGWRGAGSRGAGPPLLGGAPARERLPAVVQAGGEDAPRGPGSEALPCAEDAVRTGRDRQRPGRA